jgi:hypothetical protein
MGWPGFSPRSAADERRVLTRPSHGGVERVDRFESPKTAPISEYATRSVRIHYVPGFKRSWLDVALGKIAFGSAPTYLSGMYYKTQNQPLEELLRRYSLSPA